MTALRILLARLLDLFGADTRRERELRAEIDAHIAEATDEYVGQGMTPEEARHVALRRFGGITQTVEADRAQRRFTFFSNLRQDLQYAGRTLVRAPQSRLSANRRRGGTGRMRTRSINRFDSTARSSGTRGSRLSAW